MQKIPVKSEEMHLTNGLSTSGKIDSYLIVLFFSWGGPPLWGVPLVSFGFPLVLLACPCFSLLFLVFSWLLLAFPCLSLLSLLFFDFPCCSLLFNAFPWFSLPLLAFLAFLCFPLFFLLFQIAFHF